MKVYITATQAISPQQSFLNNVIPDEIIEYPSVLKNIPVNYKPYFQKLQSRRINKLIKTSHVCAIETINQSGIEKPDAIITGSGLGCIESTEKFLLDMINSNEGILAPTAFIQSTSNAIGAQIALHYNCKAYNVLYAQKTFSFEIALHDAFLRLKDNEENNILVGGFDEITIENHSLKQGVNIYKNTPFLNTNILNSDTKGSIPGEGSTFFVLTNSAAKNTLAEITSINMHYPEMSDKQISEWIRKCISEQNLSIKEIDLVIFGFNGDKPSDDTYKQILNQSFPDATHSFYKHMCGEYDTATAFGTWFAINAIRNNKLPKHSIIKDSNRNINYVAIYNQNNSAYHSLTILKSVIEN